MDRGVIKMLEVTWAFDVRILEKYKGFSVKLLHFNRFVLYCAASAP